MERRISRSLEQLERNRSKRLIIRQGSQGTSLKTLLLFRPGSLVAVGYMILGTGSPALLEGLTIVTCSCRWFSLSSLIAMQLATDYWELGDCPSERFGPTTATHLSKWLRHIPLDSD